MKHFVTVNAKSIPLPIKDINTDMIIPAQFMTSVSKEGYGRHLFSALKQADPQFPLNLERYAGARILIADGNFGCGSSREHAVWALIDWGIDVVISKSFADIFYNNSAKNGLLLVTLPDEAVDTLLEQAAQENLKLTVNLEKQCVMLPDGKRIEFDYDQFRKHCLINGLDDIDYIMSFSDEITAFREQQRSSIFFSTVKPNHKSLRV